MVGKTEIDETLRRVHAAQRPFKKLEKLLDLLSEARSLMADPEVEKLISGNGQMKLAVDDPAILAGSRQGTILKLAKSFDEELFTVQKIIEKAKVVVPEFANGLTPRQVVAVLDRLYRAKKIVRARRGVRGSHGKPARYGNTNYHQNGELDDDSGS